MTRQETVLLVDDDPQLRRVAGRLLGLIGFKVLAAATGEEALDNLSNYPVDLVLMDLRMPTMSGKALFHTILNQRPELAPKVMIMSGDPEAPDHQDWIQAHGLTVLAKPFESGELKAAIERVRTPGNRAQGSG
jgi:CheY-like chemotaxis protein